MSQKEETRILLTNDDGRDAPGLKALVEELSDLGEVFVVCPSEETSGISHAISLHQPIRLKEISRTFYVTDGTPSDSVLLALERILRGKPDLVVSGINQGWNLGEDLHYSGTVSAAFEAAVLGIPAFSISQKNQGDPELKKAASFSRKVAKQLLKSPLPEGIFLNINIPEGKIKGIKVTRQGKRTYPKVTIERLDPNGGKYYWLGGNPEWKGDGDTDHSAVSSGFVSITPIKVDLTFLDILHKMGDWVHSLESESP